MALGPASRGWLRGSPQGKIGAAYLTVEMHWCSKECFLSTGIGSLYSIQAKEGRKDGWVGCRDGYWIHPCASGTSSIQWMLYWNGLNQSQHQLCYYLLSDLGQVTSFLRASWNIYPRDYYKISHVEKLKGHGNVKDEKLKGCLHVATSQIYWAAILLYLRGSSVDFLMTFF